MQVQQTFTATAGRRLSIKMRKPRRNSITVRVRTLQNDIVTRRTSHADITLPTLRALGLDKCIDKFVAKFCKTMLVNLAYWCFHG